MAPMRIILDTDLRHGILTMASLSLSLTLIQTFGQI